MIPYRLARTVAEAQAAAAHLGYPVALKVVSADISHKSDVGGVRLDLRNPAEVAEAFRDMVVHLRQSGAGTPISGVLVQPMAPAGQELILGGRQDQQFGPVVLVGMGGVLVEVLNQTALRVAPIGRHQAMAMVNELPAARVLEGVRGHRPHDLDAVFEALRRLSQLLVDIPEIKELDINPLRVFEASNGCQALDARIFLT